MTIYYWESQKASGKFEADSDDKALTYVKSLNQVPSDKLRIIYREDRDSLDGLPFIIIWERPKMDEILLADLKIGQVVFLEVFQHDVDLDHIKKIDTAVVIVELSNNRLGYVHLRGNRMGDYQPIKIVDHDGSFTESKEKRKFFKTQEAATQACLDLQIEHHQSKIKKLEARKKGLTIGE
jgi:hypothetical protein